MQKNYLSVLNFFVNIKNLFSINAKKVNEKEILLKLRNVQAIRNHIIELIVILVNSNKGKSINLPTIKTVSVTDKMMARDETSIQPFIKYGDSKELQLSGNEFITALKRNDSPRALFWLSWISTKKLTVKQTRQDYKQGYRKIANVETKYHYDYIWLLGNYT